MKSKYFAWLEQISPHDVPVVISFLETENLLLIHFAWLLQSKIPISCYQIPIAYIHFSVIVSCLITWYKLFECMFPGRCVDSILMSHWITWKVGRKELGNRRTAWGEVDARVWNEMRGHWLEGEKNGITSVLVLLSSPSDVSTGKTRRRWMLCNNE